MSSQQAHGVSKQQPFHPVSVSVEGHGWVPGFSSSLRNILIPIDLERPVAFPASDDSVGARWKHNRIGFVGLVAEKLSV